MRRPYGDIDDRVRAISLKMGLTPVIWTAYNGQTFDTRGEKHHCLACEVELNRRYQIGKLQAVSSTQLASQLLSTVSSTAHQA